MKKKLKVRGLKVPPSIILSHFCNDYRIKNFYDVSFCLWENKNHQDKELEEFDFDLCIIPTNLSYKLYKSGYPLKLLCVNIWGILHIMSKGEILFSWNSLDGKSIAIPMKGNMPDTIFNVLASKNDCDMEKFDVIYCESYSEAYKFLIKGKVDIIIFDKKGNISDIIKMGNYQSGNIFYYRMNNELTHTLVIKSPYIIFHETSLGPFKKKNTKFASWSPVNKNLNFLNSLKKKIKNYESLQKKK